MSSDLSLGLSMDEVTIQNVKALDLAEEFVENTWCQVYSQTLGFVDALDRPLLNMQFSAKKYGYQEQFPNLNTLVISISFSDKAQAREEYCGYLMYSLSGETLTIVDIALLPEYRGQSIAKSSLQILLNKLSNHYQKANLSVVKGNAAQFLYHSLGFNVVAQDDVYNYMQYTKPNIVSTSAKSSKLNSMHPN